jgi:hypothetical protein
MLFLRRSGSNRSLKRKLNASRGSSHGAELFGLSLPSSGCLHAAFHLEDSGVVHPLYYLIKVEGVDLILGSEHT